MSHVSICFPVSSIWDSAVTTGLVHTSSPFPMGFFYPISHDHKDVSFLSRLKNNEPQNLTNLSRPGITTMVLPLLGNN